MTTQTPAQDVSDLNTLIDKIRATEYPQDIDGGPEEYGFRRGIDLAVDMLKRYAAKKELPDYSQPDTDMHGNLPGMWDHSDIAGGETDARELQQAQVMGEVVAWAVDRDQDPTFPRIFLTEAQADNMVNHVTVTPPATKRPVIGYAAMKAALESALTGRGNA